MIELNESQLGQNEAIERRHVIIVKKFNDGNPSLLHLLLFTSLGSICTSNSVFIWATVMRSHFICVYYSICIGSGVKYLIMNHLKIFKIYQYR